MPLDKEKKIRNSVFSAILNNEVNAVNHLTKVSFPRQRSIVGKSCRQQ